VSTVFWATSVSSRSSFIPPPFLLVSHFMFSVCSQRRTSVLLNTRKLQIPQWNATTTLVAFPVPKESHTSVFAETSASSFHYPCGLYIQWHVDSLLGNDREKSKHKKRSMFPRQQLEAATEEPGFLCDPYRDVISRTDSQSVECSRLEDCCSSVVSCCC
jgi:hypothetical protein